MVVAANVANTALVMQLQLRALSMRWWRVEGGRAEVVRASSAWLALAAKASQIVHRPARTGPFTCKPLKKTQNFHHFD